MGLNPYPKYKDSGIEWLGEVPKHWNLQKLRYLFNIKKNIAGKEGYDVLSITQQGIKIKDVESNEGQLALDYTKYQLVEIGDFAMNHMDLLTGYVDISQYRGVTSPDYRVFSLREESDSAPKYFLYLLQLCYQYKLFYHLGQGVSGFGRWRLPKEEFNNYIFPLPLPEEQKAIVSFLEPEASIIDALIAKKQRQIELLQEKRTVLISHAVTKGLNPNVKMKDSGVEWLGEVPEHWEIRRLKHVIKCLDGKRIPLNSEQRGQMQGDYPYWGANCIVDYVNDWLFDEELVLLGEDGAPFFEPNKDVAFYVSGKIWVNNHTHVLRPKGIIPKYLSYLLNVVDYRAFVFGSTRDKLTQDDMREIPVQLVPPQEQKAIVTYLDNETNKISILISKIEKSIEKLREYHATLISAAVTGKIDVRGEKAA